MKSEELLLDFVLYCTQHPEERFWQALRNWSGYSFIVATNDLDMREGVLDTFYWEKRRHDEHMVEPQAYMIPPVIKEVIKEVPVYPTQGQYQKPKRIGDQWGSYDDYREAWKNDGNISKLLERLREMNLKQMQQKLDKKVTKIAESDQDGPGWA